MAGRGEQPDSGFGIRLRAHRETAGLTQKELSDLAGVHSNTLARLERGEHEPAWPVVISLAKALKLDCTAFLATESVGEIEPGERPAGKRK